MYNANVNTSPFSIHSARITLRLIWSLTPSFKRTRLSPCALLICNCNIYIYKLENMCVGVYIYVLCAKV